MRTRLVLIHLMSIPLLAQVSRVASSESKDAVPAFGSNGPVVLRSARVKVDIAYPRGKKERSELTVLYDPQTGYYLWNLVNSKSDAADDSGVRLKIIKAQKAPVFTDSAGLVQFDFGDGLFVKAWRDRADSLEAATSAAINEVGRGLAIFEGIGYHRDYKLVPVFGRVFGFDAKIPPGYQPISSDFRCEPFTSFCPSNDNTMVSISKQGSNWRLVLGNRFDVEVILDQNFDLVSSQHLTHPKK